MARKKRQKSRDYLGRRLFQCFQSDNPDSLATRAAEDYAQLAASYTASDEERHLEILSRLGPRLTVLGKEKEAVPHEDFILQHRGRCFVEQGKLAEAQACFEQALVLRRKEGDQRGIASTQQDLDALRALL